MWVFVITFKVLSVGLVMCLYSFGCCASSCLLGVLCFAICLGFGLLACR